MKNLLSTLFVSFFYCACVFSQDKVSLLEVFGYADTYWKYDFAEQQNINAFFANNQNSISLGMLALGLKKNTGKATFLGELSFGPRGQYLTLPNGDASDNSNSFHIQNLYISYDFTDKFNMTAGYMGTFIGYEVISPASNFHYSTSYLFGAGPFQNAGIKATYSFSDKVSLMAGLFNDWNVYQDLNGVSHFGAQLVVNPVENLSTSLNFLLGTAAGGAEDYTSGTLVDLVAGYDMSPKFSLGLNVADYTFATEGGYRGAALYPKYNVSNNIALGVRGEYFKIKDVADIGGDAYTSFTVSANLKHGGLILIPELRLDNDSQPGFLTKNGAASKRAHQASLALVYAF